MASVLEASGGMQQMVAECLAVEQLLNVRMLDFVSKDRVP